MLKRLLSCETHGCPMIVARGRYVCAFEYVLEHLEGRQVKSARLDVGAGNKRTTSLVFLDGHTVPLLCPRRGDYMDVEAASQVCGLYLAGLAYLPRAAGHPEALEFLFHPEPNAAPKVPDKALRSVMLHLDSARKLWCPSAPRPTRNREDQGPERRSRRRG